MNSRYMTDILFRAIDDIIARGVLDNRKIVLFGLNAPAFACKQYLSGKGYEIYAYVDNSSPAVALFNQPDAKLTGHHMSREGRIPAFAPGGLPDRYREEYVFLLYSKYEAEMLQQLSQMGYEEGKAAFVMGGFWKTEERMKAFVPENAGEEMTWEEEKAHQIRAACYVRDLCREHGLRMYVHYGTLIGALRHNGYIPWDDDMDLCMPAEDLNRLIEIIRSRNDGYQVYYAACSDPCRHFIAKIEDTSTVMHQWDIPIELIGGMVIDIFPLGGLPGDEKEAMLHYEDIMKLGWEYDNLVVEYPEAGERIAERRNELRQTILKALVQYPFEECEYVFTIADKPGSPRVYPRRLWDQAIPVRFEGEMFDAPAGYEEFLRLHYGGYLSLPPENRRVSIHRNRIWHRNDNRKQMLVYFGVSDLYADAPRALSKLEDILAIFEKQTDKINVRFVREYDLEKRLESERPEVFRAYIRLLDQAASKGVIVSEPLSGALALVQKADAFYGAPGEICWKCQEKKIPVMIRNLEV